jgi:peptide/nickel transport system permease protein
VSAVAGSNQPLALEVLATVEQLEQPEPGVRPQLWRRVIGTRRGQVGLLILGVIVVLVFVGQAIAPYGATQIATGGSNTTPSAAHWLGTDELGRDIFSRVLAGGRNVLVIPLIGNLIATLIGGGLGIWGAYRGGRRDAIITRTFDVMLTLPPILLVLVIIAGLGQSAIVIMLSVAFFFTPRAGRVLRGAAQAVIAEDYVAAAEARGERTLAIIWRDVVPNMSSPAIADFSLRITYGIIFVATLSFLGLGTQPPNADWGLMVSENQGLWTVNPMSVLGPIIAIALLAIGFNLIADAVSDELGAASAAEVTL